MLQFGRLEYTAEDSQKTKNVRYFENGPTGKLSSIFSVISELAYVRYKQDRTLVYFNYIPAAVG